MRRFIVQGPVLIVLTMVIVVVCGLQFVAADIIKRTTTVARDVVCTGEELGVERNGVALRLNCGGRKAYTDEAETIARYAKDPSPLTCTLYESGIASCEPQKK